MRQLQDDDPLGVKVTRIKTSLGLEQVDQDALIRAAHQLMGRGIKTLRDEAIGPTFLRDIGNQTATNR